MQHLILDEFLTCAYHKPSMLAASPASAVALRVLRPATTGEAAVSLRLNLAIAHRVSRVALCRNLSSGTLSCVVVGLIPGIILHQTTAAVAITGLIITSLSCIQVLVVWMVSH